MACVARNGRNIFRTFLTRASPKSSLNETLRRGFATLNSSPKLFTQPVLNPRRCLAVSQTPTTTQWRSLHSENDKDLAKFLGEEITKVEKKKIAKTMVKEYDMRMEGTVVTLERVHETERIRIVFDLKNSVRVSDTTDDAWNFDEILDLMKETEDIDDGDEEEILEMLDVINEQIMMQPMLPACALPCHYPAFSVHISKLSGTTLCLRCSLNEGIDETEAPSKNIFPPPHDDNFLLINEVEVYTSDVPLDTYTGKFFDEHGDVRSCSRELQGMLLDTLLERDINGAFVKTLIELTSSLQRDQYVGFMKSLVKFVNEE